MDFFYTHLMPAQELFHLIIMTSLSCKNRYYSQGTSHTESTLTRRGLGSSCYNPFLQNGSSTQMDCVELLST